jgi:hypothetical protein
VLHQAPEEDRYVCDAEFITASPIPFRYFQGSQATYEGSIKEAGFREFTWHPSEVAPEDLARYGEAYWCDFHYNCLVIGLVCRK